MQQDAILKIKNSVVYGTASHLQQCLKNLSKPLLNLFFSLRSVFIIHSPSVPHLRTYERGWAVGIGWG
jgi:hypothetical protein